MNRNLLPLAVCLVLMVLLCASSLVASAAPAPTSTILTVSSGGSTVATVKAGSVLTLTAAVSSNSAKVTAGQVNFCDALVSYCTDIHLLGTAQLTSSGTAVLKFLPPVGSHSYKAVFAGTKTMATSTSAPSVLTVTGASPSVTSLASNSQVTVGGGSTTAPTGTVTLINASKNTSIRAATIGSGSAAFGLIRSEYDDPSVDSAQDAVTGDFNGDGFLDIAEVVGLNVRVLLGDGTGHFKSVTGTYLGPNSVPLFLTTGDFNGDGVLDLALGGGPQTPLMILLGNGDGTFKQGQTIAAGTGASALVLGDFNADGIPDLAFLSVSTATVFVYLGNGDGTFSGSPLAPPSTGPFPLALVAGDFNGDGIPDLAVTSQGSVEAFLSNGDGSFSAPITTLVSSSLSVIVACDFNGDGKLDLAASTDFSTTILLGNGLGSFTAGQVIGSPLSARGGPSAMFCGDFNDDGTPDLLLKIPVGTGSSNYVWLGNGGGEFEFNSIWNPLAVGDFNGDGLTDLVDQFQRFLAVTQMSSVDFSGFLTPGSGSQQVLASYSGDNNYAASTSQAITLQAPQGTPTVTVTAPAASITLGWPLTATVTGAGLVPTGSVIVYDGSAVLGTVQLNSAGVATISATTLAVGTNAITASYGGDTNYVAGVSAPLIVNVTAAGLTSSTLALKPASTNIPAGQTLAVSVAVSGSTGGAAPGGLVNLTTGSYSAWQPLASGAAAFTLPAGALNSGPNTLTASYPGDPSYAASTATSIVTVSPVVVAIPALSPVSAGGSATATATFSSGTTYQGTLNVSCSLATSPAGAQNLPTCTMAPTSLALSSATSGTSVLTVKTTAATTTSLFRTTGVNLWGIGSGATILAFLFTCGISERRWRWVSMTALFSIFAVGMATGCGGSRTSGSKGSGTPSTTPGNYVFTVTGTDASNTSITATATVTITVQ